MCWSGCARGSTMIAVAAHALCPSVVSHPLNRTLTVYSRPSFRSSKPLRRRSNLIRRKGATKTLTIGKLLGLTCRWSCRKEKRCRQENSSRAAEPNLPLKDQIQIAIAQFSNSKTSLKPSFPRVEPWATSLHPIFCYSRRKCQSIIKRWQWPRKRRQWAVCSSTVDSDKM